MLIDHVSENALLFGLYHLLFLLQSRVWRGIGSLESICEENMDLNVPTNNTFNGIFSIDNFVHENFN